MIKVKDCIIEINKYFGTNYPLEFVMPDCGLNKPKPKFDIQLQDKLSEILRFVSRIKDSGFLFHIQDLGKLDESPSYRIWMNYEETMHECHFGQISTNQSNGYLERQDLNGCLLYSISEWCKYNNYYKEKIIWKHITKENNDGPCQEGYLKIDGKEIHIFNFYDTDTFYLEYKGFFGEKYKHKLDNFLKPDVLQEVAQSIALNDIKYIVYDPDYCDLTKNK